MKKILFIFVFICGIFYLLKAQPDTIPDFTWGNARFFNLNVGESCFYLQKEIKLLAVENHFNSLKVGNDTVFIKVSRRTLPQTAGSIRIYVADNKAVKNISGNKAVHGLLKKDALVCVSKVVSKLLVPENFVFPISFNDGFVWSCEEDSYMFSYDGNTAAKTQRSLENFGVDFNLQDARGNSKHWVVAVENSKVVQISEKQKTGSVNETSVLLQSTSQPEIFYLYRHLVGKSLEIKQGQVLEMGDPLGSVWGDEKWGHLSFSVIQSDSIPNIEKGIKNVVNAFPQLYELYFQNSISIAKNYRKGRIFFGKPAELYGNQKNAISFEDYTGKGWNTGTWNSADRVEWVTKGQDGNVRLQKTIFTGTPARSTMPDKSYNYEINVPWGAYRIRAKVGDVDLPAWQKVTFEGVEAGTFRTEKGQFMWTPEKIVKVMDGKLTIRMYISEIEDKPAGISEIVFQQAE